MVARSTAPTVRFGIGVTDLTKLSRDFQSVDKALSRGLTAVLKGAVEPVAVAARTNASFSRRIPPTIRVQSSGGKAKVRVWVRAGNARAPEAAPLENRGRPGVFRHPVFGDRKVWVSQAAHPYLWPALVENASDIAGAVDAAVGEYLEQLR